jgi:hypothetical protein
VTALQLARDLANFQRALEELADWYPRDWDFDWRSPAAAESYLYLLNELADLPVDQVMIGVAVANAFKVYQAAGLRWAPAIEAERERQQARRRQADAEYAEAVRRHELAITAECPYCGAAPGLVCRTAGPSGIGHPKGVHDHRDRYRAAEHLLDPPDPPWGDDDPPPGWSP